MKLTGAVLVRAVLPLMLASAGCYETTPHRVEVAARVASTDCAATVRGVFAGAGFVQLPSPPRTWMLFAPRGKGAYSSLVDSRAGVGVTFSGSEGALDDCHVTLEALSADASCPGAQSGAGGPVMCGGPVILTPPAQCLVTPQLSCDLTSAPSPDNNAAVDELARQLRVALGPKSRVD